MIPPTLIMCGSVSRKVEKRTCSDFIWRKRRSKRPILSSRAAVTTVVILALSKNIEMPISEIEPITIVKSNTFQLSLK